MQVAIDDQGMYQYFLKKRHLEKISEFNLAEKKNRKVSLVWRLKSKSKNKTELK